MTVLNEATRPGGGLYGSLQIQREVGNFIVTEGEYPPATKIGRHDHELASISVVMAGGYDEHFGRKTRRCDPGTVIVHPEGEHHEEVHDPVQTKLLTIEIDAGLLRSLRSDMRAFDDAWHRTDYAIAALAQRLRFEISRSDETSALVIESTVLDVLASLDRTRVPATKGSAWLPIVRDHLEAEFQSAPSMQELSLLAGVHPVHLARAFRRRFGCSVGMYVRRLQVGKAIVLLHDRRNSLSDVACEAGFADQSHMTRIVRAQTGLPPGAWRRRRDEPRDR